MSDNILKAQAKEQAQLRSSIYESQNEAQQIGSMSAEESKAIRARQDARSRVLGMILIGMCVLFFAITIVKMVV